MPCLSWAILSEQFDICPQVYIMIVHIVYKHRIYLQVRLDSKHRLHLDYLIANSGHSCTSG